MSEPGGKGHGRRQGADDRAFGENYDGIEWIPLCRKHATRLDDEGRCPVCWDAALNNKEEWRHD